MQLLEGHLLLHGYASALVWAVGVFLSVQGRNMYWAAASFSFGLGFRAHPSKP